MQTFDLTALLAQRQDSGRPWLEFLRTSTLSMGVYHLRAGQPDLQRPHTEDEVYYALAGRATLRSDREVQEVVPGSLVFVERAVPHRFEAIQEDLTLLVFFAPPEGSLRGRGSS
jgi:quercetin dioxygenase-like cupin family protein